MNICSVAIAASMSTENDVIRINKTLKLLISEKKQCWVIPPLEFQRLGIYGALNHGGATHY